MGLEIIGAILVIVGSAVGVTWKISASLNEVCSVCAELKTAITQNGTAIAKNGEAIKELHTESKEMYKKICQIEAILWAAGLHPEHKETKKEM